MSANLSRARRKRLERVQERVNLISEADARFFKRFPDRNHRVRLTSAAELEANAAATGAAQIKTEPGYRWFTAVRQIAPGARVRLFVQNAADAEPDMDEANAAAVYDYLSRAGGSRAADVERQIADVLKGAKR